MDHLFVSLCSERDSAGSAYLQWSALNLCQALLKKNNQNAAFVAWFCDKVLWQDGTGFSDAISKARSDSPLSSVASVLTLVCQMMHDIGLHCHSSLFGHCNICVLNFSSLVCSKGQADDHGMDCAADAAPPTLCMGVALLQTASQVWCYLTYLHLLTKSVMACT